MPSPSSNLLAAACALILLVSLPYQAHSEVASRTVGYTSITCADGSDTVVSIPFHRPATFSSAVAGNPVISATTATIAAQAERSLTQDELTAEKHFLRFLSGSRNGRIFPVSSHDTDSITIELEGDNFADVGAGDLFEVVAYWTLASLFPPAEQTTFHLSTGVLPPQRKSRLLFFDDIGTGTGLAPDRVFFVTSEGWFRSDQGFPAADHVVIPPGKAFIVRHPAGTGTTNFAPRHRVHVGAQSIALRKRNDGAQDTTVALDRPVAVKLSQLDLAGAFVDSGSNSESARNDELLLFDNVTAATNKAPSATYFRVGGQWRRDDGSSFPVSDDVEVPPSTGILIRKAAAASGTIDRWLNLPRF